MTIVSPDHIRAEWGGGADESHVRAEAISRWRTALAQQPIEAVLVCGAPGSGKSTWLAQHARAGVLYYDATLSHQATRRQLIRLAEGAGVSVRIVWMRTPLDVCLRRNAERDRVTPEALVRQLHRELEACQPRERSVEIISHSS